MAKPVPKLDDATLRPSRITIPDSLAAWCTTDTWERAFHSHGAHFTDRTRAFALDFPNPPDVVAHPSTEAELAATVDWAGSNGYVVVPFGGGSSVVWGVNPPEADAIVTIALDRLDKVLEIDEVSRAARIEAGVLGPHLEDQLRPSGYTLRHFPQSFRFSSLGGWIATAVRRPLRDEPDAHRRLRRVGADDHSSRAGGSRAGCRAAAQVRHPTGW